MNSGRTIGLAGAGSIGCFVGGMLAAGGRRVALLARPRVIGEIEANGLRLTSFEGADQTIAASRLVLSDNPSIFNETGVVLVTVKSADTAEMADIIARNAPPRQSFAQQRDVADAVLQTDDDGVGWRMPCNDIRNLGGIRALDGHQHDGGVVKNRGVFG